MNTNYAAIIKQNGNDWFGWIEEVPGVNCQEKTQEELAYSLHTKKTAISRIENHAENIKLSTLEKLANALGKNLRLEIA